MTYSVKRRLVNVYARERVSRIGTWFVDIPRTSSTAVRNDLGLAYGYPYGKYTIFGAHTSGRQLPLRDHASAREAREFLTKRVWSGLDSFSIVRNPFDRFVSYYRWRRHTNAIGDDISFKDNCSALVGGSCGHNTLFAKPHLKSSCAQLLYDENGRCLVKHVIRFEHRDAGLTRMAEILRLPSLGTSRLQQVDVPRPDHYSEWYDDESRAIVEDAFADDLAAFNYRF